MSCGEYNGISLYAMCCSVNGSVCFVCCVSDSVCELFGETICNTFECGCLNVMVWFSEVGGAILDIPCLSSKEYVCFACDPSVCLDALSMCFDCVLVCRKLCPHLELDLMCFLFLCYLFM